MTVKFNWARALIAAALMSIPLALFGFFLLLQGEFREFRDIRAAVDRSIETRVELAALLAEHQDIETGQRGYVLTGDRAFLEPYERAADHVDVTFSQLKSRVTHDPALLQGVGRIQVLSSEKLAFARRSIMLVEKGRAGVARQEIAGGKGKRLMDAIRAEVARLDRLESIRLQATTSSRDASRERVEKTINLLLAALSLLLAAVALYTGRTIRQRQVALGRVQNLSERLRAIFNGAVDGMLLLDEGGYILELNPSVLRLFGFDEPELIGKHNTYLMAHPPRLSNSQQWLRGVGAAGRLGAGRREEFIGKRVDGSTFDTDVAISRFSDAGTTYYIAVIRDITERKRVEALKTEFVSTVSHELRTPLTSIGGSLGLLAAGAVGPLGEKASRLVQIAHNNCERLIRLINDILDIEKIESGRMNFDMRRLHLAPLVDRTLAANRQFAEDNGVRLASHQPVGALSVMGDPDRLEQLLTNLVSNAIKHSPPAGAVEIWTEQRGQYARVEVCDRGPGVPEDFRGRIFGKFAMADSSDSRTRGGTGLGLSIAREIAQIHGGDVNFRDREGGGTIFFVDLPLSEASSFGGVAGRSDLPLLLHIDDDHDCLSIIASAFEGRAAVVSVATLDEAQRAIEKHAFAAAIIDIGLAPGNGLDLVPNLRAGKPGLPVVLFTAVDEAQSNSGADAVLVKSRSSLEDLVDTTMALIERRDRTAA